MAPLFTDLSHDNIRFISHILIPPLDSFINLLWASKGQPSFAKERILPDGCASLLFNFSGTINARSADQNISLPNCFISGVTSTYFDLSYSDLHEQVGIIFKPHGAFALFNIPMSEFHNAAVDVHLIIKHVFREVFEKMQQTTSLEQRLSLLNSFLIKQLSTKTMEPSIPYLTALLQTNINVTQLADRVGFSQQHVSRLFRKHIGVSPKMIQRILRFQNAVNLIKQAPGSLTYTGYTANYYDQSHFINEFQSLGGISPGKLFDHHSDTIDRIAII